MVHGGVVKSKGADRLTLLASYIAALVHDYEHSGFNNDFLIKTSHDLAVTYNLQSPLENHHLAASTRVFLQQRYNFLGVRLHPIHKLNVVIPLSVHDVIQTELVMMCPKYCMYMSSKDW